MRRRSALVVGFAAIVATLLLLLMRRDREAPSSLDAGRDAAAPAAAPPTLASRRPPTVPRGRTAEVRTDADAAAEAPGDETTPARSVSLRVSLVDALTGTPVEEALSLGSSLEWIASGESVSVSVKGSDLRELVVVRPPAGYVVWDSKTWISGPLATGVKEVRAVLPLHRAIPLRLTIRDPDGRIAEGASIAAITVGGRRFWDRGVVTPTHEIEVLLPFLPGEETRVALNWVPSTVDSLVQSGTRDPEEGISDPEWKGPVPQRPWEAWTADVRLKGPCAHFDMPIEVDFDSPSEESFGAAENAPTRSVTVRALDRDGAPVTDAKLSFEDFEATTGAAGAAVFDKVRPGTRRFTMAARGRLPRTVEANVPSDGDFAIDLREPLGAILEVVVVGEDDRPRAFAEVTPATAFFDVTGDVQRLDPYTDALGRRTFSRVQPGKAVVRASWAGHSGHATVTLVDGERTRARIVVK